MKEWILAYLPSGDKLIMEIGAAIGAASSFLFGGWSDALGWLAICVILDWVTGTIAAAKLGEWNSDTGWRGVVKKFLVFGIVALCHGIDVSIPIHIVKLMDMAVMAFLLNEVGSILENLGKLGFGSVIPPFIRQAIKALKDKQEKEIEKLETKNE